jgi:ABC-type iron transport system FetAB ATPase subunit
LLRAERLKTAGLPPLSFEVANGECLVVEGPSGAGKTRLLRAIADLDAVPGQVFVDGAERREMAGTRWRQLVRYAAAEPAWWTDTAREALPPGPQVTSRAERMAASLGLSPDLLDKPLSLLSTGERLRLALVRSLVDEPRVALLDEPTASLDVASAALVEELIRFQLLAGRIVVLVSHDTGLAARLAHARLQLARPVTAGRAQGMAR